MNWFLYCRDLRQERVNFRQDCSIAKTVIKTVLLFHIVNGQFLQNKMSLAITNQNRRRNIDHDRIKRIKTHCQRNRSSLPSI